MAKIKIHSGGLMIGEEIAIKINHPESGCEYNPVMIYGKIMDKIGDKYVMKDRDKNIHVLSVDRIEKFV